MAANTTGYSVAAATLTKGAYVSVADGSADGMVNLLKGLATVHIDAGAPAATDPGIGLIPKMNETLSWSGMTTGDEVYVRAESDDCEIVVIKS